MSRTIRCIIMDDEPPAIRLLLKFIDQVPGLKCLDTTTSAVAAISLVEQYRPDIVFLDIQMPELYHRKNKWKSMGLFVLVLM